jgi:hypothetical protein
VLPERPTGTEGFSEEALAALITRDAMIGVAKVTPPGEEGRAWMGCMAWAACTGWARS